MMQSRRERERERKREVPYSGKLSREKTFKNFAILQQSAKLFFTKCSLPTDLQSFLPRKFPTIRQIVRQHKLMIVFDNTDLPDKKEENCGLPHSISQ